MLNIKSGELQLENISYSLSSNTQKDLFDETFPKELIRDINDVHTGYIWYNIWGSILSKEDMMLISLCFNPSKALERIVLYPHVFPGAALRDSDWSKARFLEIKTVCDNWLRNNFKLNAHNEFKWGTISSVSDERSWSSSILIKY